MIRRRQFIALLGGAAVWPLTARAQQSTTAVIGFMHSQSPDSYGGVLGAFRKSLSEAGYIEGQNLKIEYRWANDQLDQLPALAADLVRRRVSVIVAGGGSQSTLAAKAATSTIPIVLVTGSDPVALGLVASMNRPGGNITGVTFITSILASKRVGLLSDLVPRASTIGYFSSSRFQTSDRETNDVLAAGRTLGRQVIVVDLHEAGEFESGFFKLAQNRVDALLVGAFPIFTSNRAHLVELAARYKIPSLYQNRDYVLDGGLMSYGPSQEDAFRLGGIYVGRFLRELSQPICQSSSQVE
jgi:putative ABC transport system substrate-binding protein